MTEQIKAEHVFRVSDGDAILLLGSADLLHSYHVLDGSGFKRVPMKHTEMLKPLHQQLFMPPTGDWGEPILKLPCPLADLLRFFTSESYGQILNQPLVRWMKQRVEINRARSGGEWIDRAADDLFMLRSTDVVALLPRFDKAKFKLPDPIDLLKLLAWCDVEESRDSGVGHPTNESIASLVQSRLEASEAAALRAMRAKSDEAGNPGSLGNDDENVRPKLDHRRALRAHERNSRINVITALAFHIDIPELKDWDSASRIELNQRIAELVAAAKIPLQKGMGGAENIRSAIERAYKAGKTLTATPKIDTVQKILREIRLIPKSYVVTT